MSVTAPMPDARRRGRRWSRSKGSARIFDVSKPLAQPRARRQPRRHADARSPACRFAIPRGETFALVGESGSGKSTVAKMVVGLLPPSAGEVSIDGVDIWTRTRRRRAAAAAPAHPDDLPGPLSPASIRAGACGDIIAEPITAFGLVAGKRERARPRRRAADAGRARSRATAANTRTNSPAASASASPSRARSPRNPEFIVCDEPTSALDVSVQAQILNLMRDLQERLGLTYLFISHNLAVVRHMANRIGVMYLGRLVEIAPARDAVRRRRATPIRACCSMPCPTSTDGPPAQAGRGRGPEPDRPAAGLPFPPALPAQV